MARALPEYFGKSHSVLIPGFLNPLLVILFLLRLSILIQFNPLIREAKFAHSDKKMCLSRLGQIIYGALSFVTVALIATAMFTKGWNQFSQEVDNTINGVKNGNFSKPLNFGLFCGFPTSNTTNSSTTTIGTSSPLLSTTSTGTFSPSTTQVPTSTSNGLDLSAIFKDTGVFCADWFNSATTWQKVVIVAMCLALVTAVLAFLWNLFTFCACFCHGSITKPLPGLASLTSLFLVVGLATFYWYNQSDINLGDFLDQVRLNGGTDLFDTVKGTAADIHSFLLKNNGVSYSFWLGCGAAIVAMANAIVGALVVCLADKCV